MRLSTPTFIASTLDGVSESGRDDRLAIGDVREPVRAGTIFAFLVTGLGRDIDPSICAADAGAEAALRAAWQDIDDAVDARRKVGVEHRGLPLLVAFLLEGRQRRARAGV